MCLGHISSKDQIRYELEKLGEELKKKKRHHKNSKLLIN
jgi:hypothetical protein